MLKHDLSKKKVCTSCLSCCLVLFGLNFFMYEMDALPLLFKSEATLIVFFVCNSFPKIRDWCLMPNELCFSYIMTKINYILHTSYR